MARQGVEFAISGVARRARHRALVAMLASLLAGCSVTTPASIVSTNGQLPPGSAIELAPDEGDGSLRAAFRQALDEALASRRIEIVGGAPVVAAFAIAARNARAGVADPATSSEENIIWESHPRPGTMFDACETQRLRATLILLDRDEGDILYRGVAESNLCAYDEADLADLANALIADANRTVTGES